MKNFFRKSPLICKIFTILELLVVISVIMILISLLLPAFTKAKEISKQIACVNNLKQLGYSFICYANDNFDFYPPMRSGATDRWPYLLFSYINNPYIFICQSHSDNKKRLEVYKTSEGWSLSSYYNPDYGYNWRYIGTSYGIGFTTYPDYGIPATINQIKTPSNTVLAIDTVSVGTNASQSYLERGYYTAAWIMETYNSVSDRHNRGCNVLWADGHSVYSKRKDIYFDGTGDSSKEYLWDRK